MPTFGLVSLGLDYAKGVEIGCGTTVPLYYVVRRRGHSRERVASGMAPHLHECIIVVAVLT